jgi:hypothetical protein
MASGSQGHRETRPGRRSVLGVAILFAVTLASASGAFAADQGCKSSHALTGRCYTVRGELSLATEIGVYIELPRPGKTLSVRNAPDHDSRQVLPENVLHVLRTPPRPYQILGTYEVCPVPSQPPLIEAPHVCIESATGLVGTRRRPAQP